MKVDYIALSVPIFFILIGIELGYTFYKKLKYYRLNDSLANLSQGIGSQLVGILFKTVLFFGYKYLFENYRLFDLPKSIWVWIGLFLAVDFFYYWFHRMSHQINALWAAHIVHHQSEEYNLTVALRQSWFQGWFSWLFYLPLALIGFDPLMFLTISSFNTLYQFWIHTRTIKSMGFLEHILNTPSHHRVHHGSNPKYIDKNHAGTLIIWDKMFGTFQQEEEEVYYGITTPLASWNPVWANVHYWVELWQTVKQTKSFKDQIKVFIKPPGWFPVALGGFKSAPEIDVENYSKYDAKHDNKTVVYVSLQFLMALGSASALLFLQAKLVYWVLLVLIGFVIATLLTCGALLEEKKWVSVFEYNRLIISFLIIYLIRNIGMPPYILFGIIAFQILSSVLFLYIQNTAPNVKKIPSV